MKQHLLSHAEVLARRQGIDAFSFADLAKGAGIRKASVHYHFPTKGDLTVDLIDSYAARTLAALAEVDGKSAGQRLGHILQLYRDALMGGDAMCLCVSFTASLPSLPQNTRDRVEAFQNDVQAWLKAVFSDAQRDGTLADVEDPNAETAACFATLEGAQLAARAAQSMTPYDAATALLKRRIVQGDPE